ncbi:ABC transporter permease [Bacillus sp. JJ722]|uniref:ABC transporter permease n=1 Tax=Bacillus sp. JJ722 TaxID=3122973 RepID=UPI002FFE3FBD
MNILHLALANIKKRKSAAISLFILVILASLLLNIGLSIFTRLDSFYEKKTEKLNGAQFVSVFSNYNDVQKQIDFIHNYKYTNKVEHEDSLLLPGIEIAFSKGHLTSTVTILNEETKRTLSPIKLVEETEDLKGAKIYAPYIFKTGGGYELGESLKIEYGKKEYTYKIAGFFEDTLLGNTISGSFKFFLPQTEYKELEKNLSSTEKSTYIAATLTDESKLSDLNKKYSKAFPSKGLLTDIKINTENSKLNYIMPINTIAIILIAFSFIMLIVALVVVKFRVTNTIDDDIANIGSLKAIGYTSKQILYSIMTQFMLITVIGGLLGILLSYIALPTLGNIVSASIGLLWTQQFNIWINIFSLFLMIFLVLGVTTLSGMKIKTISPIIALRGGIQTHNFKKNRFSLDKTKFGLHISLGLKNMYVNRKQNIWVMLIVTALTFACAFSSVLYYNFTFDKSSIFRLVGAEQCNVVVMAKGGEKSSNLFPAIKKIDGIKKTGMLSQKSAIINEETVMAYVSDDFDKLEWNTVYEGRQPRYDNEIAISGAISKSTGKKVGDTIKVTFNQTTKEYLITGLTQQFNDGSMKPISLTLEGYQKLYPSFERDSLSIYLDDTVTSADFTKQLKSQFGDQVIVVDMDEAFQSQMSSYIKSIFYIMVLIVIMTALTVSLILYLIVKTMIIKRKRELGILKAIGYTTFQLMTQITMSFLPVVTAGVLLGGIIGCLYTNSILSILFTGLGIFNASFTVNVPLIIAFCIVIVLIAYVVSMLVGRRIKHISAHGLITE